MPMSSFMPPSFTEYDFCEIHLYCQKYLPPPPAPHWCGGAAPAGGGAVGWVWGGGGVGVNQTCLQMGLLGILEKWPLPTPRF